MRARSFLKIVSILFTLNFAACTASLTGPAPEVPVNDGFFDSKPSIAGPEVEGHWSSLCNLKSTQQYRRFDLVFQGNTVSRKEFLFSDSSCVKLMGQVSSTGRFRFIEKFADESFGIEYAFDHDNGLISFPQEKLVVHSNMLYLSDFQTGEAARVLKTEPLYKDGTSTPPPSETPTPPADKKAIVASSYEQARYAVCITQRTGVVIDFQGPFRQDGTTATARIGAKRCNSRNAIAWDETPTTYTTSFVKGLPQVTFLQNGEDVGNIQAWGSYKGLSGSVDASALFYGNSGGCYFVVNDGLLNLPFREQCF